MKNLMDTLQAKESQLARLQKEVDALRAAARILAEEEEKGATKRARRSQATSAHEPTVITQPLMIRSVLLEKGEPLHVEQIAKAIEKKYDVKYKPLYLTSIIYRALKKRRLFRKEAPNTFGLLEWPPIQKNLNPSDDLRIQ